jgi:hypothetical protein
MGGWGEGTNNGEVLKTRWRRGRIQSIGRGAKMSGMKA